jgi:AcrR family transcriptional regulator
MPADSRHTKERILAKATLLFAEHGYDGVSLRTIATEADTHLALIHYHFGTKEDLYRAIWAGRYSGPIEWRTRMFAEIDYSRPREELLEVLVDIFMRPIVDLKEGDPVSRSFMQIMGHEMGDMKETQRGVLRDYLDPTGREVMNAFQRALPEVSPADVAWGFQAMAGTATLHMVDVDRISRMSGGAAKSGDTAAAFPRLRAFLVGGWLELARRCQRMPSEVGKYPWRANGEAPFVWAADCDPTTIASEQPAQQLRGRSKARRPFARTKKRAATR